MWDEINDMQGEIYDIEAFNEQVKELRSLMDKCIDLETYQKICEQDQINIGK